MAWAAKRNDIIIAVAFNATQLPTGTDISIAELADDLCRDIFTGHRTIHELNHGRAAVELPIPVNQYLTGYGEYVHLPQWEYNLFGAINDKTLLHNRHFFIWDWRHRYGYEIAGAFPWEEFNKVRNTHPNDRMSVILDNSLEAPDYYNHLKPLCDQLIESGIRSKDILFWACIEEPDIPVSNIDTKCGYTIGLRNIPSQEYETLYHFIMLAKNPRPLRLMMANEILNRKLELYGNLSCGAGQPDYDFYNTPYIDLKHKQRFPFLLDGFVHYTDKRQYDVSDDKINKAAINVICETSQDEVLDGVILWSKPFITEKTSKAFLLCQFPLMVSVPGMVDKLRRHGFDMFDDIIDHSYDTELDPWQRIHMIGEQLETICNITDIAALRSQHWDRLISNRQKLIMIFRDLNSVNATKLEQWLKDTQ